MIQLLIDRCIIFVSLELLLFKYNSNNNKKAFQQIKGKIEPKTLIAPLTFLA